MSINTKLTQEEINQYYELISQGFSQRKAAIILDIPRTTIQHYLKRVAELENKEQTNPLVFEHNGHSFEFPNLVDSSHVVKKSSKPKKPTICVIADTQCKPTESLEYMLWIGKYIADTKPDVVVHIGDHWDMPSLSSYDKGKASSEGRRFVDDINAGNKGLELLELAMTEDPTYKPRKVFCKGNHCHRIDRYVEDNPELIGTLGTEFLPLEERGWEVHDFLKPVEIEGIYFVHYLPNPMNGRPYSGTASSILKTVGKSFVVGHKQVLDVTIRPIIDGNHQLGIVCGACYPFDESYKGFLGNNHYRGLTMLSNVQNGFGCPSFISLEHMKERYYD